MEEFLAVAFSYPTIVYTTLVCIVLLYWMVVLVGFVDLDLFEPSGLDAGLDGAFDGAIEGAGEALDGALEGAAEGLDGAVEGLDGAADGLDAGDVDVDIDADGAGSSLGVLHALGLRNAPITVTFSVLSLTAWFVALVLTSKLGGGMLIGTAVGFGAFVVAVPVTSLITRPLKPLFTDHHAPAARNRDLVGQTCVIKTLTADAGFGQAEVRDGGAGLLVRVRCDDSTEMKRGDRGLIVGYDEETRVYLVEPEDRLLGRNS